MANNLLPNDVIRTIPILGKDAAGDVVPLPAGVVPTVSSSDPGSNAVIVGGNSYALNATVRLVQNVSITIDDGSLTPEVLVWDVVDDVKPTSVASDLLHFTDVTQAVPPDATAAPTPAPTVTPAPTPAPTAAPTP